MISEKRFFEEMCKDIEAEKIIYSGEEQKIDTNKDTYDRQEVDQLIMENTKTLREQFQEELQKEIAKLKENPNNTDVQVIEPQENTEE